jgi:hypothetical protein
VDSIQGLSPEEKSKILNVVLNSPEYEAFQSRYGIWILIISVAIASSMFGVAFTTVEEGIVRGLSYLALIVGAVVLAFAIGFISTSLRVMAFAFIMIMDLAGLIVLVKKLIATQSLPYLFALMASLGGAWIAYEVSATICIWIYLRGTKRFLNALARKSLDSSGNQNG